MALGHAVGTGSTPPDRWFDRAVQVVLGANPRWLLIFTSWWLLAPVLVACLAAAVRRRQWRLAAAVPLCPLVAAAVNTALKHFFDRRNGPYLEYPSGHTTLLVTVMGMLVVVAAGQRWALIAATATSLLGALGLIACGYHWITDTVGAALLASALVCAAALLAGGPRRARSARRGLVPVLAVVCGAGLGAPALAAADPADTAADFVDVRTVVPDAVIDLRYATANNFVHTALYPPDARCLVHRSLTPGLVAAAATLRRASRLLVFWDCYRPHAVQVRLFQAVPDPTFVARPGPFARSHVAGRSVDVTLADPGARCPAAQQTAGVCLVDMGTDFDDFSAAASAFAATGVGAPAAANRAVLRSAMSDGGFAPYSGEWWHFDGPGAGTDRPLVDVALSAAVGG